MREGADSLSQRGTANSDHNLVHVAQLSTAVSRLFERLGPNEDFDPFDTPLELLRLNMHGMNRRGQNRSAQLPNKLFRW